MSFIIAYEKKLLEWILGSKNFEDSDVAGACHIAHGVSYKQIKG